MAAKFCEHTEKHVIAHFKKVSLMGYELYLH